VRLVCVDPARAHEVWPYVRDLILAAMKRGDLGSFRPVEDNVLRGDALLWLAIAREEHQDVDEHQGVHARLRGLLLRGLCRERPDGDGRRIAAAAVTALHETEWRKVCVVVACGARPREGRGWLALLDGIENYARKAGCSAVRIMGRKGWARVLTSYRAKRIILERDL
jgi:hypothetical protein